MQQQTQESSLRQKIGSLLQNLGGRAASSRPEEIWKPEQTDFLTEDILKELSPDTPLPLRLRAIKELGDVVSIKRLEKYGVQAVWLLVKDLLEPNQSTEARQLVLGFLQSLIKGQYEELGILRAHFFRVVQTHKLLEDSQLCFNVVVTLTDNGRDIQYIEQDVGPYMASVLTNVSQNERCIESLKMLVNLIKCNASYLEEDNLTQMINTCCCLITSSKQLEVSELSLDVINAVMCYSSLPSSSLQDVTNTLCHTINVSSLQKNSLEIVLRLLGTHLGYTAILTLCRILQEKSNWENPIILRGAVFCISMSLWGSQRVDSLQVSFASVLPSIKEVSKCPHTIVLYEISLSMLRLVRTYSHQFHSSEWDSIYAILDHVQQHLIGLQYNSLDADTNVLLHVVYDLFFAVSNCHSDHTHHHGMDANQFYNVVDKAISLHQVRVESVVTTIYASWQPLINKLLIHEINTLDIGSIKWVEHLLNIMKKFYVNERNPSVRLEALNQLKDIVTQHLLCYEVELLEGVVLPLFMPISEENDEDICCEVMQLLVLILSDSTPQWAPSIIGIMNSVLQKGLYLMNKKVKGKELMLRSSKSAVFGLTPLFKSKLNTSSDIAAQIFYLLVNYLQQQIEEECFSSTACVIRIKIFTCLFSLRSNEEGWIGFCDESKQITFSPFYVCEKPPEQEDSIVTFDEVYLNCNKVFIAILNCIAKEREWAVLVEVLVGLNKLLEDRKLVLSSLSNLSDLCIQICYIADNQLRWIDKLYNVPTRRPVEDELAVYLYPILCSLCSYGTHLDRMAQNTLICCLERGVVGTCSLLCIRALNVATLEMQTSMARLLPKVLHRIGQVSATPTLAIPVLELLMSIIALPSLYSGFVEQQYLAIFGITLPYTDPSKSNSYVVTLAHHVTAMWFIRCRIQYRPTVAKFINKSLSTLLAVNRGILFDEPGIRRQRSVSFTSSSSHVSQSQNQSTVTTRVGGVGGVVSSKSSSNNNNDQLTDLVDVCIDMMTRYSFSNISTQPFRSSAADFLVGGGPSKTWLLGNSLVTITTSSTGGGVQGVCPRCKAIRRSLQPDPGVLLVGNESYNPTNPSSVQEKEEELLIPSNLCSCWCRGWAEIKIRRPTGNVAWLMRIQNKLDILATPLTSSDDYDWSLLGLSNEIIEEEEEEEEEWGILTTDDTYDNNSVIYNESHDQQLETLNQPLNQSTNNQSTDNQSINDQCQDQLTNDGSQDQSVNDKSQDQSVNDESQDQSANDQYQNQSTNDESQEQSTSVPVNVKRQPTSHSWSERSVVSTPISKTTLTNNRSYSLSVPLEHLPPLFSYDETLGRSPSLSTDLLTDPEQLELLASARTQLSEDRGEDEYTSSSSNSDYTDNEELIIEDKQQETTAELPQEKDNHEQSQQPVLEDVVSTDPVIIKSEQQISTASEPKLSVAPTLQSSSTRSSPKHSLDHNSSTPRSYKRVMFAKTPSKTPPTTTTKTSSSHHQREDIPTDKFNNPAFIFLQLYHSGSLGFTLTDTPLLLPSSESIERALKVLDHIPPYNTHKIGVVYVDKDQTNEQDILGNTSGSSRYLMFLKGLGRMIKLTECPPNMIYLGGLDTSGIDGDFACFWEDDITQVIFHVATLIPTLASNPHCSNKKLHIGNDFVTIVYNDSQNKPDFGIIKGQFNYAEVIIEPLPCSMNKVSLAVKEGLHSFIDCSPSLVSDKCLPLLVRQKALLANLASLVMLSESSTDCYPSNWLGRLYQIHHIRDKILSDGGGVGGDRRDHSPTTTPTYIPDFTLYCKD